MKEMMRHPLNEKIRNDPDFLKSMPEKYRLMYLLSKQMMFNSTMDAVERLSKQENWSEDEKQNAINEAIRLKDPNNWSDDEKENEADSPNDCSEDEGEGIGISIVYYKDPKNGSEDEKENATSEDEKENKAVSPNNWYCEVCDKNYKKGSKNRHLNSKRHKNKM